MVQLIVMARRIIDRIKDPRTGIHRYIALFFICLLGFGNYFCYDTPGTLEVAIEDAMSVTTSQFTSLYALYSWPNVIMCFFGGLLIDKVLGIRLGAIIFLILLLIGQYTLAFGALTGQFWLMQLGRFIYGLGGESLSVAQNTYVVAWFQGRELNVVFGLQVAVSRAGSALAYNIIQQLFESISKDYSSKTALSYVLMIAGLSCVLSFITSLILAYMDKRAERILARPSLISEEKISLKDATNFKSEFWMLAIICVTFYITIFPFIALGSKFFQTKYNYSPSDANRIDSTVYLISAITSPLIGFMVDKVGRNLVFLLVASILVMFSHSILALTSSVNLWIPMISLGIGYSIMCSALWPLVALVVPQNQLGTAYGVMQAVQNLGLAVTSNFTGFIVDWKGYIIVELFFVLWVAISVIFSIVLMIQDNAREGNLNNTAAERKRIEELRSE